MTTETGTLSASAVESMFDRIAPVYDVMNLVMTAGLDRSWRSLAATAVVRPGDRVLDACCGTGDLALAGLAAGGSVTGLDFSEPMLELARSKSSRLGLDVEFVQGNALELPFADDAFDAATVGFGVRNLVDLRSGIAELARVVRPGARVVILEITTPTDPPLSWFYRLWFDAAVPLLGAVAGDRDAYTYLPESVRRFPPPLELAEMMHQVGLRSIRYLLLAGGIVAIHSGTLQEKGPR